MVGSIQYVSTIQTTYKHFYISNKKQDIEINCLENKFYTHFTLSIVDYCL